METIKKRSCICFILLFIILSLLIITFYSPIKEVKAATLNLGTANYEGSTYNCYYNIVGASYSITGTQFYQTDFRIYLDGIKAKKNFFSNFKYNIQFTLRKGTNSKYKTISFEIKYYNYSVPDDEREIFKQSDLNGSGNYVLEWFGTISAQSVATVSGSFPFSVV